MNKYIAILFVFLCGCGGSSPSSTTTPDPWTPPPPLTETCSATIGWEPSMFREHGESFLPEEFDKFTIYVAEAAGQNQFDLLFVFDVSDSMVSTYKMQDLPQQSYMYMTVTDTNGHSSAFSPEWSWDCITGKPVGN